MILLLGALSAQALFVVVSPSSFFRPREVPSYDQPDKQPMPSINQTSANTKNVIHISDETFSNLDSAIDLNELQEMLGIPKGMSPESISSLKADNILRILDQDQYIANPKQAHCRPQKKVVDLGLANAGDVTHFPTCVRVKQCGGCCADKNLLSCQPTASRKVIFRVLKLMRQDSSNLLFSRNRRQRRPKRNTEFEYKNMNVTVEEHTSCSCMCTLSPRECNTRVHFHDDKTCSCICRNKDEEGKCNQKSTHYWDKNSCKCYCKKEIKCSTNIIFDHNTCSCVEEKTRIDVRDLFFRSTNPIGPVLRRRKPVLVPVGNS